MIGIEITWACLDCGSELITNSAVEDKLIRVTTPDRCGCGNKTRYKIKTFKQIELVKKK